jgi:hypothetical protein
MWRRVALVRTDGSENVSFPSVLQVLVTANVVPSLLIISTLIMEATLSSETSVLTRATCRHIPTDGCSDDV